MADAPSPRTLSTSWDEVALVCRRCQKRGSGPKKLKAREVYDALRRALKRRPHRVRVVMTECLGLCPKRAIAVSVPSASARPIAFAITEVAEIDAAVRTAEGDEDRRETPSR